MFYTQTKYASECSVACISVCCIETFLWRACFAFFPSSCFFFDVIGWSSEVASSSVGSVGRGIHLGTIDINVSNAPAHTATDRRRTAWHHRRKQQQPRTSSRAVNIWHHVTSTIRKAFWRHLRISAAEIGSRSGISDRPRRDPPNATSRVLRCRQRQRSLALFAVNTLASIWRSERKWYRTSKLCYAHDSVCTCFTVSDEANRTSKKYYLHRGRTLQISYALPIYMMEFIYRRCRLIPSPNVMPQHFALFCAPFLQTESTVHNLKLFHIQQRKFCFFNS